MPRLPSSAARYVASCAVLACLSALTAAPPGECDPATPPPDAAIRPVAAPGKLLPPSAPFPVAAPPPSANASPRAAADPPPPCVAVRVRVPAEVAPGQEIVYKIVAENVSRAAAHHVTVRVPAPTAAKYVRASPEPDAVGPPLVWKLGTLGAGEKREIEMVAVPTGEGDVGCIARVQFEHGQAVKTRLSQPGVRIKKTGPVEAVKYDPQKFEIEVSNTGKAVAKDVVVRETLPKGLDYANGTPSASGENPLTWRLGDVEPGKTRLIKYDAIPSELGPLKTKAVVTARGGVEREAGHALRVGEPALSVALTGPKHRHVGRPATYRLTVRNTGDLLARDVELSDELPAEIEFVRSATGKLDGDHVRWKLGALAAGASKTVEVTVRATMAGDFKNVVTATAGGRLGEQAMTRTRFDPDGGLGLEVDRADEAVAVGKAAAWTLRVFNRGRQPQSNVTVVVELPEGLKADARAVAGARVEGRRVVLPKLASLPPGAEQAATLRLTAESPGERAVVAHAGSDATGPAGARVEETSRAGEATTSRLQAGQKLRSTFGR